MKAAAAVREKIAFVEQGAPFQIVQYRDSVLTAAGTLGYHPELEIQFIRRGSVIYTIRDRKYILRPNSLLVIYPNEIHTFRSERVGSSVSKITLMFKPSFAGLPPAGKIVRGEDCRHMRLSAVEAATLTRIAADLQSEVDTRPAQWMAMCRLRIRELVILIMRACSHPLHEDVANPLVAQVLDIIEKRFSDPITNELLARAAGVSISRLMHLFTEHMGQGIKQYVLQLRILKACELLLAEPGLKVESVAQTVGFKYVADFNRAFKTQIRMTPAEYRALRPSRQVPRQPPES